MELLLFQQAGPRLTFITQQGVRPAMANPTIEQYEYHLVWAWDHGSSDPEGGDTRASMLRPVQLPTVTACNRTGDARRSAS